MFSSTALNTFIYLLPIALAFIIGRISRKIEIKDDSLLCTGCMYGEYPDSDECG